MGGLVGLDYVAVDVIARASGIALTAATLDFVRILEHEIMTFERSKDADLRK